MYKPPRRVTPGAAGGRLDEEKPRLPGLALDQGRREQDCSTGPTTPMTEIL